MTRNRTNQDGQGEQRGAAFKSGCRASCQKILARIAGVKETIFQESAKALRTQEHLLRLALNEAEAAAWQTMYPHLIFPTLATEKVQAVVAWDAKMQSLRRAQHAFWAASLAKNRGNHQPGVEI